MKRQQRLGQHFLTSQSVAKSIVDAAKITKNDIVLEIGTGKGILLPFLCKRAGLVTSIETDKKLYDYVKSKFSNIPNLVLKQGDGFKSKENFTIFVSNLPYSQSRYTLEWLIQKNFSRAIIMTQLEFAKKIFSKTGKKRKAISVLVNHAAKIEQIIKVRKTNFLPPPKVDSVVLKLTMKTMISKELIKTVNKIFSYRKKNIKNIIKQFGKTIQCNKRLDELNGDEIIKIAKKISK